jgi:hypothetical protein
MFGRRWEGLSCDCVDIYYGFSGDTGNFSADAARAGGDAQRYHDHENCRDLNFHDFSMFKLFVVKKLGAEFLVEEILVLDFEI